MVHLYPLMRTIIRGSLITEDLLRLTYCKFCSPSGVHSLPVRLLPSHHRQLSHNRVVGSYSLSFNGLIDYYTKVFYMSTTFSERIIKSASVCKCYYQCGCAKYNGNDDHRVICGTKRLTAIPCTFFVLTEASKFHRVAYNIYPVHT